MRLMEGEEAGELRWREQVLDAALVWGTRLGGILALLLGLSLWRVDPWRFVSPGFLGMFGAYGGLIVLRFRRGLSYQGRALGFCLLVLATGTAALYSVGLFPAPILVNTLAVVSARLFLGRRALFAMLVATTLGLFSMGLVQVPGHWPVPTGPEQYGALIALRIAAGYAVVSTLLVLLEGHVLDRLERALLATSEALRRLRVTEQQRSQTQAVLAQTEDALIRSQKLEAVGRLAAGVGHDFNNSLQVVLSWTSLLRDERDPKLVEEGLDALEQAAVQASELTQRLLEFGRRDVRAPKVTSPVQLLLDSVKSLRRLLPEDIVIGLEVEGDVPTVLVDAAQISHVLLNLGLNARDAMPSGGALTLGVTCLPKDQLPSGVNAAGGAERWVQLWVRDTGTGMTAETRSHVFEPFFTTKGERGTGLGLATAYTMVERNQGSILVRSEEGKGSEFRLYFPEHGAALPAVAAGRVSLRRSGSAVVMVAEDDPQVRLSVVKVLGTAGFRVLESADAASALELIESVGAEIDVLCTDGVMPGGRTRELIERYLARCPGGQVLLCSGYVREELLRRQIDAGSLAYLPKPFQPAELVERIDALLAEARATTVPQPVE